MLTSLIWMFALRKRSWSTLWALFLASLRMPPLSASWIIISPAFFLRVFSIAISLWVTMPSFVVWSSPVSSTQKTSGAQSVMVTVPSRDT